MENKKHSKERITFEEGTEAETNCFLSLSKVLNTDKDISKDSTDITNGKYNTVEKETTNASEASLTFNKFSIDYSK